MQEPLFSQRPRLPEIGRWKAAGWDLHTGSKQRGHGRSRRGDMRLPTWQPACQADVIPENLQVHPRELSCPASVQASPLGPWVCESDGLCRVCSDMEVLLHQGDGQNARRRQRGTRLVPPQLFPARGHSCHSGPARNRSALPSPSAAPCLVFQLPIAQVCRCWSVIWCLLNPPNCTEAHPVLVFLSSVVPWILDCRINASLPPDAAADFAGCSSEGTTPKLMMQHCIKHRLRGVVYNRRGHGGTSLVPGSNSSGVRPVAHRCCVPLV